MKLLIVRHGDPDYTIDSLTEKGWREVRFSTYAVPMIIGEVRRYLRDYNTIAVHSIWWIKI